MPWAYLTIRFVTSGVGGETAGAGFVDRGGVDGRPMMTVNIGRETELVGNGTITTGFWLSQNTEAKRKNVNRHQLCL